MAELTENTFSAYLGVDFQQKLMWQLLVEPEFAEKIIPDLAIEYFDDPNLRRLFVIILEFYKEYQKVPNLQNKSIQQAINKYKTPNNIIEEESLFSVIKRIELWNERIINKQMLYDGDVVQKAAHQFVKQQEYRKLAENITDKVKSGDIKNKYIIASIEEKFQKISHIGEEEDDCEEVIEGIDKALRKEFRQPIPTGIGAIDVLTGGGLGKGEIGVILTPSGVGKTTALTVIANTAYEDEKNVAQIIFEDTKDQIKRKHYTIWAKSKLSKLNDDEEEIERVKKVVYDKVKSLEGKGRLIIKRFKQENTTMMDVRNWMLAYQKKHGFKFDMLVLDYLDCLESHKKVPDRNEAELAIIKGFEALASDFDIPAWTAIQSNRSGFGAEFIEAQQSGGNIKRIQKAHFFMSVAKTQEQKEAQLANISILKARFAQDGQKFEDCIFNNDAMQIIIEDPRYKYSKINKSLKHHDENDINKLEKHVESVQTKIHEKICVRESEIMEKLNSDNVNATVGNAMSDPQKINELLRMNQLNEFETPKIHDAGSEIETIHINTSRMDLSQEELKEIVEFAKEVVKEKSEEIFELDESEEINEGVSEGMNEEATNIVGGGVNDGVGDGVKIEDTSSFEWTGETITVNSNEIPEVKMDENIKLEPKIESKIEENSISRMPLHKILEEKSDVEFKFVDPDAPQGDEKNIQEILAKLRKNQNVIKNE